MADDGTTRRPRSSKAERLSRKQRGAGSSPVVASNPNGFAFWRIAIAPYVALADIVHHNIDAGLDAKL